MSSVFIPLTVAAAVVNSGPSSSSSIIPPISSTSSIPLRSKTMTTMTASAPKSFYQRLPLKIKKLSDRAVLPTPGSTYAAGIDLSSAAQMTIPAGQRALVPTDLAIACPPGTYGRIAPRSGLAYKFGIDVGAGVIDADYRGPVGVILFNFGSNDFVINPGDRIAQLILEQIIQPHIMDCTNEELGDLPPLQADVDEEMTVRGSNGFGSTGVAAMMTDAAPASNALFTTKTIDTSSTTSTLQDDNNAKKQRTVSPRDPPAADGTTDFMDDSKLE